MRSGRRTRAAAGLSRFPGRSVALPLVVLAVAPRLLAAQTATESAPPRNAPILLVERDERTVNPAGEAVQVLPKSSAFYLSAADAMEREGKEYAARGTLAEGLAATGDIEILSRLAPIEDAHGDGAADFYARLAKAPQLTKEERLAAWERGFTVSLRDRDFEHARDFAARLDAAGHPEFQSRLETHHAEAGEVLIPGGRDGLALIAFAKPGVSANEFMAEYARALLANVCTDICFGADLYKKSIDDYLATVSELESMGTRDGRQVAITISLKDLDESRRTKRVLHLLGIELRSENGAVRLVEGVKRGEARRQDTVAALGIDLVGMEKGLQSGKPFTLEITDEPAMVYPNAEIWKKAFPARWDANFARMLLHSPQIARLYQSISEIEPHTLDALFGSIPPAEVANHFASELFRYGPALAVSGHHAVVPGGPRAEPVWATLTGVGPDRPGPFFRALLEAPSLLAYFYQISELDARHQAFFTANVDRAMRFYLLSKALTHETEFHGDLRIETSISHFLRSVPIDDKGHVIFPGSPRLWLDIKGAGNDLQQSFTSEGQNLPESGAALEDAILTYLVEVRNEAAGPKGSALESLVGLAQLNARFREPMDEATATLLAQHYAECWPLYAYLSDLPAVNQTGLVHLFDLIDHLRRKPPLVQNVKMGQLYALLGWVSILSRNQALSGEQAAQLFSQIGAALQTAMGQGTMPQTSLKLARSIATACGGDAAESLDDAVRLCMLGPGTMTGDARALDFQRVLRLQSAPSLEELKTIADAAQRILSAPEQDKSGDADAVAAIVQAQAKRIAEVSAHVPNVQIPRGRRIGIREREAIELYDPAPIQKYAAALNRVAGQAHPGLNAAKKLASELLRALDPQVTAALAGPIYAYYLRSTDLVISDDPLLLRKHRYVDFLVAECERPIVERPAFFPSSDGIGSHFAGGFGEFALTAGHAAAPGFRQGGRGAESMIAAQLGAIRSVPWNRLTEDDQRLAALRILAAREWIVEASTDGDYLEALRQATLGLMPPARRASLLASLAHHDWTEIWRAVPLPDLYTLGCAFSAYSLPRADGSPVFRELRALEMRGRGAHVKYLGRIPYLADGCGDLQLLSDAPYEEYARRLMEEDLGERSADFKLYLASRADNLGIEPREWGPVAEQLAARAFAASELTDYHDWRSLFAAYGSITTNDLKKALAP